jgi:hypothetical protein
VPKQYAGNESVALTPYLCQQITQGPSYKGRAGLGGDRTFIKSSGVGCPSWNGTSTNNGRITEERAMDGRILAQAGFNDTRRLSSLRKSRVGSDAEGTHTQSGGNNEEAKELHGHFMIETVGVRDDEAVLLNDTLKPTKLWQMVVLLQKERVKSRHLCAYDIHQKANVNRSLRPVLLWLFRTSLTPRKLNPIFVHKGGKIREIDTTRLSQTNLVK